MKNGFLIKYLFVVWFVFLLVPFLKGSTPDQHTKVILRSIGHEFLLQLDDSTSQVLPIEKIGERYAIRFQNHFCFEPDFLIFSAKKILEENNIEEDYIVETEKCGSLIVVHSFIASASDDDGLKACGQRELMTDCYTFYFTKIEQEPISTSTSGMKMGLIFLLISFGLIGIWFLLSFYKKKESPLENEHLIRIGEYQYDKKAMILTIKGQSLELSHKESELLLLLLTNENKTLEREYILKMVWEDGGHYVGRTLDVYISKLRKRLEEDASLKIINVRGVGYKFVVT